VSTPGVAAVVATRNAEVLHQLPIAGPDARRPDVMCDVESADFWTVLLEAPLVGVAVVDTSLFLCLGGLTGQRIDSCTVRMGIHCHASGFRCGMSLRRETYSAVSTRGMEEFMATWRIASAECCVVRTVPDILGRTRNRLLIKTTWYGTWDY
jgi:hypothetical protein